MHRKATKRNWAATIPKYFPMLFSSGERDPIGDFGNGIKTTVNHLKLDGFTKISMNLYPNIRHEILNEDNKYQVFHDIVDTWILKKN